MKYLMKSLVDFPVLFRLCLFHAGEDSERGSLLIPYETW